MVVHGRDFKKYIFFAIVFLLILLSYFILQPYLVAIISTFVLAFLVRPLHSFLTKKIGTRSAAIICVIAVFVVLFLPFSFVAGIVVKQSYFYATGDNFERLVSSVLTHPLLASFGFDIRSENIDALGKTALNFLIGLMRPALASLANLIIMIFLMFFGLYYCLISWDKISDELKKYIPFKEKERALAEISDTTRSIIYGTLFIGLIEFFIAAIGFFVLGVDAALLLALLIFLAAFIPAFGPGVVWVPTALVYLLFGNYFVAMGVIVIGLIISVGIELFVRVKLLGYKTRINPFLMLLGIFGGVSLFGIFGFVIGPLVLVYTLKILKEIVGE